MYLIFADSVWSTVGAGLLEGFLPVLATIATTALVLLIKKGIDKMGVTRSQEIDGMIDKYVGIGIGYAERFASSKFGGDAKVSGSDKMSLAVETVVGELDQSGITGVATSLIVARIESALEGDSKKEATS